MSKLQSVSFNSVEEFLDYLPDEERQVVEALRDIIMSNVPEVEERLSYNVPYYFRKRRLFFIWPPSIPWGKKGPAGVQFGFCYGSEMNDDLKWLDKGDRKQVCLKEFNTVKDIDYEVLTAYIFEAVSVDDSSR